ncbi:MAG: nucleotide sugar dehydrogenase [Ignavibacteriaceae bacterium]|jgi:UDP-N-acetyl-D-glucosamine dehydrogenase
MSHKEELLKKISSHTAKIGIIGLGYVGLPLGLTFTRKGFSVIGFDVDEKKIPLLNAGQSYIKHIKAEEISEAVNAKLFEATSDFSRLPEVDAIIICVPTPLNEHREPDISYIENSGKVVAKYLREGQLVVLESSTYPGTTEEVLLPLFEEKPHSGSLLIKEREKYKVGEDFFLAFSPEREDPNNGYFNTATIPKVVGGVTADCLEVACAVYDQVIVKTVPVSSARAAEAAKLLENIYRSVNIALINELKMVFDRMDINVWEVIEAAKTKPFGFNAFYPGPGLGGHCIPIDPFYLTWKAREFEISTKFIELAGEINTQQPYYVIQRSMEALNKQGKTINGAKVLILGAAYKKDIDDMRESPSLKLIEILKHKGAIVDYNDPLIKELPATRKYNYKMKSIELTEENLSSYDLVLISTDHTNYDYPFIGKHSQLVIDTRNAMKNVDDRSNIVFA